MNSKPATAIILAGGRSSRMMTDKALLSVKGEKLIEIIINRIKKNFPEILISSSTKGKYEFLGYPVIIDEHPGGGGLMGILSGLRASTNKVNFVIACDVPEIDLKFLRKILSLADDYDIVVPAYTDGKYEPLFAVYNKNIIPLIEEQIAAKNRKISCLFSRCHTKYVTMDNQLWFKNLNTLEDYKAYLTLLDIKE